MSFFVKAVTRALERFPVVMPALMATRLSGVIIAISALREQQPRPGSACVTQCAITLFVEIERQIAEYATQARNGKLPWRRYRAARSLSPTAVLLVRYVNANH